MNKLIMSLFTLVLTACVHHHHIYALQNDAIDGMHKTFSGTVLSVEKDGDFLLETRGKLVFIDMDKQKSQVQLGDRITVSGVVDNDINNSEAPEIDAQDITDWNAE